MFDERRAPVVINSDREWALAQCPPWAVRSASDYRGDVGEIADETDDERMLRQRRERDRSVTFVWDWFVDDQISNFERFFAHERKTYADWSRLWRLSWWPKADPAKRLPKSVAKLIPSVPHPFARRGTPEFDTGLKAATPAERRLFEKIGVVQFTPDDLRAKVLTREKAPT